MISSDQKKGWDRQREAPRYTSFRDLRVTYEGHSEDVATRPADLSTRGMFINTSRNFPEGAILNVAFRLNRTQVEINTRCEVRYCLPGVGVGVEFVEIDAGSVRAIETEIRLANGELASEARTTE